MRKNEEEKYWKEKLESEENRVYDGNTLEIGLKKDEKGRSRWTSVLHLLTGDLFPMKNFVLSSKNEDNPYRKDGEYDDILDQDFSNSTFYEQMISYIFQIVFSSRKISPGRMVLLLACLSGLVGYVYYRYLYLQRREQRMDFVDLALRQKYKFLK